jgi:hypothetical protein
MLIFWYCRIIILFIPTEFLIFCYFQVKIGFGKATVYYFEENNRCFMHKSPAPPPPLSPEKNADMEIGTALTDCESRNCCGLGKSLYFEMNKIL